MISRRGRHARRGRSGQIVALCAAAALLACGSSSSPAGQAGGGDGLSSSSGSSGSPGSSGASSGSSESSSSGSATSSGSSGSSSGGTTGEPTPGDDASSPADTDGAAVAADGSPGTTTPVACTKGQVTPNEVVMIGDSYLDKSFGNVGANIIADAQMAGSLAASTTYREYYLAGAAMNNGSGQLNIPYQYETMAKTALFVTDPTDIKVVIMDGGGNDVLIDQQSCLTDMTQAAQLADMPCMNAVTNTVARTKSLWQEMATDGVKQIVYFFYPHLNPAGGGLLPTPSPGVNWIDDYSAPLYQASAAARASRRRPPRPRAPAPRPARSAPSSTPARPSPATRALRGTGARLDPERSRAPQRDGVRRHRQPGVGRHGRQLRRAVAPLRRRRERKNRKVTRSEEVSGFRWRRRSSFRPSKRPRRSSESPETFRPSALPVSPLGSDWPSRGASAWCRV